MTRSHPEQDFQRQVAEYLAWKLGGNAWFTSFPAGGGGLIRGRFLKATGLKAGVPDILIIDAGRAYWLELKAKYRSPSAAQDECHRALRLAHSDVAVVKTLEDVDAALSQWGIAVRPNVRAA